MGLENSQSGQPDENAREFARNAVQIPAELRLSSGPRFRVWVLDLSPAGFRIETGNHIPINHVVYLTIPGFQPLQSRVAWSFRDQYGCQLTQKFYGAVFEHIAAKFPALVAQRS